MKMKPIRTVHALCGSNFFAGNVEIFAYYLVILPTILSI